MGKYEELFSPVRLGAHMLKNRIIMPGMDTNFCNADGTVSPQMLSYYGKRARGGVGMIILEYTSVDYPAGRGSLIQLQLAEREVVPGFRALADLVHSCDTKLLAQLHHAGTRAVQVPGIRVVGPVDDKSGKTPIYGLTAGEIKGLTGKFAIAAKHAQEAGLDGVEVHAGHGYLLGQFLSPLTNTRTDEYGGDTSGRTRFLVEIIRAIREACGPAFLISVRLAVKDWDPRGLKVEEGIEIAKIVDRESVDLLNLTTGIKYGYMSASETQDRPDGFRLDLARAVKPHVKTPVSIVGKLRTGEMCNDVIKSKTADLVVVGRQLICDPNWPDKLREGREDEVRRCLNCLDGCYSALGINSGIRCAINPYVGYESMYDEDNLPRVHDPKRVVVIGGGVTGMQAAVTAAERGHKVKLIEKDSVLGGQMIIASVPPHKDILKSTTDYFELRMHKEGVEVRLGMEADVESVAALKPDTVILATGSVPAVPPIPGIDTAVQSWDILSGDYTMPEGKRVVIIGGGNVGCETALHMLEHGNSITILEMLDTVSGGQEKTHRARDLDIMKKAGVNIQTLARVQKVTAEGVEYVDKDGQTILAQADLVVVSTSQRPAGEDLAQKLVTKGINVKRAGDAVAMGKIRVNVRSGFHAGYDA